MLSFQQCQQLLPKVVLAPVLPIRLVQTEFLFQGVDCEGDDPDVFALWQTRWLGRWALFAPSMATDRGDRWMICGGRSAAWKIELPILRQKVLDGLH